MRRPPAADIQRRPLSSKIQVAQPSNERDKTSSTGPIFPRTRFNPMPLFRSAFFLLVLLPVLNGAGLGAQTAPMKFTDTAPIVLVPGDTTPVRVPIQSLRVPAVTIDSARVYFPGDPAPQVAVTPATLELRRGQVAPLTLRLASSTAVQGMGYLVVASDTHVISRTVQVAKPAPRAPIAQWTTLRSMKCWDLLPWCRAAALPFVVRDTAHGQLFRKTKDNASIDGLASAGAKGSGSSGILTVQGLDGPGTYSGTLTVDGASVALTVLARHWIGWLVLALSFGVLMGLWLLHYAGVRRTLWDLRARCAELDERIQALGTVGGLEPDPANARGRVARALRSVEMLRSAAFRSLEGQPAYNAALAELTAMEAAVDAWPTLETRVTTLQKTIADAAPSLGNANGPPSHDGTRRVEARIMAWARALAGPRKVPVDGAAELAKRLDDAVTGLHTGVLLNGAAQNAHTWIVALKAVPITDGQEVLKVTEAERTLSEAWWELWESDDPAALAARQTQADLAAVEKLLSQLNFRLPGQERAPAEAMALDLTAAREQTVFVSPPGADDGNEKKVGTLARWMTALGQRLRPRRWRQLIAAWDVVFLLLAVVLAILTGLKQLYFDTTFWGTPGDYVTAILWGFGVKVVVDITIASVTRFFGVRSGAPPPVAPVPMVDAGRPA
jgi:hypothetical protein